MLFTPWELGSVTSPNRVLFGPHPTNLGFTRALSERHVAYYERRARGGCGVVVTEMASVHDSDWPYERAPLASLCEPGWGAIADALHRHGSLAIAGLGHYGMQGSTSYSQGVLWAPSLVPHVITHEMPLAITEREIAELIEGFASATLLARRAGCDGVEINAGQCSLLRQFLSGLTNQRVDQYSDRSRLVREVLLAVRAAASGGVVGLRFVADELAPWAGITPELAGPLVAELAPLCDYLVIERGAIYAEAATRPDMQVEPGFNRALLAQLGEFVPATTTLVAQGSIVQVAMAQEWLALGLCGAVEMTRAQIADPDLVAKSNGVLAGTVRPCVLCNQNCQVRDARNPRVSCAVNPAAGYEDEPSLDEVNDQALGGVTVTVAGAGVAGMEAARCAVLRGATVEIVERASHTGGALRDAARLPGRARWLALLEYYEAELARLHLSVSFESPARDVDEPNVVAVGRTAGSYEFRDGNDGSLPVIDAVESDTVAVASSRIVVLDPVGGPVGVGVAEMLARSGHVVTVITPDLVAGTQLSLTGDLVAANARLAQCGVALIIHAKAVAVRGGEVIVEDRYDGTMSTVTADVVVHAGFDLPHEGQWNATPIGDARAPRGVLHAVLEARRAVNALAESAR